MNPEFKKVIEMNYRFEEVQKLRFSVFDVDNATATLDDDDHLGAIECTLAEVHRGVCTVHCLSYKLHVQWSISSILVQ